MQCDGNEDARNVAKQKKMKGPVPWVQDCFRSLGMCDKLQHMAHSSGITMIVLADVIFSSSNIVPTVEIVTETSKVGKHVGV